MDPRTPTGPDGLPQAASPATAHSRIGVSGSAAITQQKEENGHARQEEGRGQDQGQAGTRQAAQARHRRRTQERLRALIAPWWERDPAALRREIRVLRRAGFRPAKGVGPCNALVLTFVDQGKRYEIEFADNYLEEGMATAVRLSADGLIERIARVAGPSAAVEAVRDVSAPGVPSRANGQSVLVPAQWDVSSEGGNGSLELGRALYGPGLAALQISGLDRSDDFAKSAAVFARAFPVPVRGLWARADRLSTPTGSLEQEVAAVEARIAAAHGLSVQAVRERLSGAQVGALIEGEGAYPYWRFVRRSRKGRPLVLRRIWHGDSTLADRAPYASAIGDRRVAIIGCGAVGWAVAALLARSGIRDLVLYDNDIIGVGNLTRLGAVLGQVGGFKATALAQTLEAIGPGIAVRPYLDEVGHAVGASGLVTERPDLLMNLTGETLSTLETNRAALVFGKPAIFAWVSNGIWAGRVVRVRPFDSACYECVRDSEPPPLHAIGPVPAVGAWTGSVIDVEAFAAAVAAAAVRTLLGAPVSRTNPDHFVLDFRALVPKARSIAIARDPDCLECGSGVGVQA